MSHMSYIYYMRLYATKVRVYLYASIIIIKNIYIIINKYIYYI